ncbi:MAG: dihydrolipoyl dehydrogenase [Candidatus Micrarchaeota archaeon]
MGQLTTKTEIAVIGGGPGGYTAAIRAAQLGFDVILIEKNLLGGCCTNIGYIPSKALIHAASLKCEAEGAGDMGIDAKVKLDFRKMMAWKDGVVKGLRDGIGTLLKMNGVEVIKGRAFFVSSKALSVETEGGMRTIEFDKAIIASGGRPKALGGIPIDHDSVMDSEDVFSLSELPKSILIVGGGYIAIEMAAMFARLGSKTTIAYRGERLARNLDPDLSDALHKGLTKIGVDVLFKSEVLKNGRGSAVVKTPDGERRVAFDKMLVAAGREPFTQDLGLEKTKAKMDKDGLIIVDKTMKTGDDRIYAIGDIVPGPALAHKAFREGKVAAEAIAGQKSAFDNEALPFVVYCEPELASVGLTEAEARERGFKVKTGRMPFSAIGKARCIGKTEGFVKMVADEDGVLLGVHIAGAGAGDLIAEAALAIEMGAMLEDLASTNHAHPTMPEGIMEASEDALGKAIHLYRGKRGK